MRRLLLGFLVSVFLISFSTFAQTPTLVSGTVTDANGLPYSFARVSAQLIPSTASPTVLVNGNPVQIFGQQNASADATGAFSMNLFCNTAGGGCGVISPAGTQWQITVNINGFPPPFGTGPQACSATVTVTGATQSLTSNFNACPALGRVGAGSGTVNIVSSNPGTCTTGQVFFNTSNNQLLVCSSTNTLTVVGGTGSVTTFSYSETGIDPLYNGVVTNPTTTPTLTETANPTQPGFFLRGPIPINSATNPTFENSGINASTVNGTTVTVSAAPATAAATAAIFFGTTASGQNVPSPDGTWTNFPSTGGTILGSLPRFKNISSAAKLTASSTIGVSDSWASSLSFLGGSISAVGNATGFGGCGTGCATVTMGAVTAGHTIVVYGSWSSSTYPRDVRATDNLGNIYFLMYFVGLGGGGGGNFALIAQNVTGGTPTITLNTTAQINFGNTIAFELTGPTAYFTGPNGPWQFGPITQADLAPALATPALTVKNLAGNVSVVANTLTTVDSVTLPGLPASCTTNGCRVRISYSYYTAGGLDGMSYVDDGTNKWGQATCGLPTNNFSVCSTSAISPTQFSAGATPTFTIKVIDEGAITVCTATAAAAPCNTGPTNIPAVTSRMAAEVVVMP